MKSEMPSRPILSVALAVDRQERNSKLQFGQIGYDFAMGWVNIVSAATDGTIVAQGSRPRHALAQITY
jgi:hypothetical protein